MVDVGRKEMSWLRPDVTSDPALKRQMTSLYHREQIRSQLSGLLLNCGIRSTKF